jgi:hypothetical protein
MSERLIGLGVLIWENAAAGIVSFTHPITSIVLKVLIVKKIHLRKNKV